MKKNWSKPTCKTVAANDLSIHIQAAARSWGDCLFGVLR